MGQPVCSLRCGVAVWVIWMALSGCGGGGDAPEVSPATAERLVGAAFSERIAQDSALKSAGIAVERVECVPTESPLRFQCTVTPTRGLRPNTTVYEVSPDGSRLVN